MTPLRVALVAEDYYPQLGGVPEHVHHLARELEALFRKERFDIVHVHGGLSPTLGLVAPRAAWRAGIPVVATFHTWFPDSLGYRVLRAPFQRMLDRHAATIAVSSAAREAMARYFTAPWEIIPNGVDTTFFQPGLGHGNSGRLAQYPTSCGWDASSPATTSGPCLLRCRAFSSAIPAPG